MWRQHGEALVVRVEKGKQPSEVFIPILAKLEIDVQDFSERPLPAGGNGDKRWRQGRRGRRIRPAALMDAVGIGVGHTQVLPCKLEIIGDQLQQVGAEARRRLPEIRPGIEKELLSFLEVLHVEADVATKREEKA